MNIMQETLYSLDQLYGTVKTKSLKKLPVNLHAHKQIALKRKTGKNSD